MINKLIDRIFKQVSEPQPTPKITPPREDEVRLGRFKQLQELNFVTRDEYFTWKRRWLDEYLELCQHIRALKNELKEEQRDVSRGKVLEVDLSAFGVHTQLSFHRQLATTAISIRWASRELAGRLREQRLNRERESLS